MKKIFLILLLANGNPIKPINKKSKTLGLFFGYKTDFWEKLSFEIQVDLLFASYEIFKIKPQIQPHDFLGISVGYRF